MDFTKYLALLESNALYFARADQFDDPFEGASTKANLTARPAWYSGPEWGTEKAQEALAMLPKMYEASRRWTYVNCWHANEVESAAMWRLYARSNEAIAVRSTFAKLAAQMPDNTYVGVVQYIDYETEFIPESNSFYRFMRKRKSFAHEREVRAVRQAPITVGEEMKALQPNPALGIIVPVSLPDLITHVHVAPTAPPWFGELVEKSTRRFGLELPVLRSSLDDTPVY
jgi:hypothetical protein